MNMDMILMLFCFLLAESIYCFLMKKRSEKRNIGLGEKSPGNNIMTRQKPGKVIVQKLISWMNDVIFISVKIIGYIPVHFIRKIFYKYIFWMTIDKKVVIYYGLEARSPWKINIGKGSIIGDHAILDARFGISIGENVNLSTGVWIWTLQHDVNSHSFGVEGQGKEVYIGDRAWISSRASILPGAIIGEGCVIAAGGVALGKEYDSYAVYGGVPAKKIGSRNKMLDYVFDGEHRLFI